jgi:hypothetical protein
MASGLGGAMRLAMFCCGDIVRPTPSVAVAANTPLPFDTARALVTRMDTDGSAVVVRDPGIYSVNFMMEANAASERMPFVLRVNDTAMSSPSVKGWFFAVLTLARGQQIHIFNAGSTPYTVDTQCNPYLLVSRIG